MSQETDANPTIFFRDISTMTRKLRTRFDARAANLGVTQSRARLLLVLARNDGASQAALAEMTDVERPTMARMIDGLEECGMVHREISQEDRRQRHVYLTEAARSHVETILNLTESLREEVVSGIAPEDLDLAHRVILQMIDNLVKLDQS